MFLLALAVLTGTFFFYPYLYEFWMVFVFVVPYAFGLAFLRPSIQANLTKAVDQDQQGEVSGWSTNVQSLSQSVAPIIATAFLQRGFWQVGALKLDAYHLIGFTGAALCGVLAVLVVVDLRRHPNLYKDKRPHATPKKKCEPRLEHSTKASRAVGPDHVGLANAVSSPDKDSPDPTESLEDR